MRSAARVARTAVNADIQFDENSRSLAALSNSVGGNIVEGSKEDQCADL